MSSGPTAESFDIGGACFSSKSGKGRLCSSDLSDVKLTVFLFLFLFSFLIFLRFNGLKFRGVVF